MCHNSSLDGPTRPIYGLSWLEIIDKINPETQNSDGGEQVQKIHAEMCL